MLANFRLNIRPFRDSNAENRYDKRLTSQTVGRPEDFHNALEDL